MQDSTEWLRRKSTVVHQHGRRHGRFEMVPSLVVTENRQALVEYLATTFALSDDETRVALSNFLTDAGEGIFRGPYLRVRSPFQQVDSDWQSPLDWLPDDFTPYAHQAASFARLTSGGGHEPEPTLVTTGTGSGKTECFLYPCWTTAPGCGTGVRRASRH